MALGGYKEFDHIYVNGVCVGSTSSSEDIPIGEHCKGATYDGKRVQQIALDLNAPLRPHVMITEFAFVGSSYVGYKFDVGGTGELEEWENFITDLLSHIKALRQGDVK